MPTAYTIADAINEVGFHLKCASTDDTKAMLELLLPQLEHIERDATAVNDKDHFDRTALFLASACGHTETVRLLAEMGADIGARTSERAYLSQTALLAASSWGRADTVEALLTKGAEVNDSDIWGQTALILAATGGHTEVVDVLISRGADINRKDKREGYTALMHAIDGVKHLKPSENFQEKIVALLLSKGADIDAKDKNGTTALMYAVDLHETAIVKLLLSKGADVRSMNQFGLSASSLARSSMMRDLLGPSVGEASPKENVGSKRWWQFWK